MGNSEPGEKKGIYGLGRYQTNVRIFLPAFTPQASAVGPSAVRRLSILAGQEVLFASNVTVCSQKRQIFRFGPLTILCSCFIWLESQPCSPSATIVAILQQLSKDRGEKGGGEQGRQKERWRGTYFQQTDPSSSVSLGKFCFCFLSYPFETSSHEAETLASHSWEWSFPLLFIISLFHCLYPFKY